MAAPTLATGKSGRHYVWPPGGGEHELMVPSVTTILNEKAKPALPNWAAKMVASYAVENKDAWLELPDADAIDLLKRAPYRHTNRRAELGTAIHELMEQLIVTSPGDFIGIDGDEPEEVVPYVAAAMQAAADLELVPLHVEPTVFSRTYHYAGSADAFATVTWEGERTIAVVDWKTGKGVYDEVSLQLTAYARGDFIGTPEGDELEVPPCDIGLAIHLKPDATYAAYPVEVTSPRLFKTFTALRSLHHYSANVARTALGKPLKGTSFDTSWFPRSDNE